MKKVFSSIECCVLVLLVAVSVQTPVFAQAKKLTGDKAAMMVLDSARRAYNGGKYDFAAERFRAFLQTHAKHAEAPAASYGLGLSLLKSAKEADLSGAVAAFKQASARADFADRPLAIYYTGVASRELGTWILNHPAESQKRHGSYYKSTATRSITEAATHFASAVDAFVARSKASPATTAPADQPDVKWAARARCDQCDTLLRLGQYKQVAALARAFLDDKIMGKGPLAPQVTYHLGYAYFSMKDYLAAGRTLSKLAPFGQSFGGHARYMLARTHHLAKEHPEAAALYKAVLTDYQTRRAAAIKTVQNPRRMPPEQLARLQALATGPPPDYIVRAAFYSALLLAESGRFANAAKGFADFAEKYPKDSLVPEAQLRQGYCNLELRIYDTAIKVFQPLLKDPKFSDRAIWWTAKARVGGANPSDTKAYSAALATAIKELTQAAAVAYERARHNPRSRAGIRRYDILLELGDTQQLAGQYKDAATTYQSILAYGSTYDRAEETTQRLATAYHLCGDYGRSDQTCDSFEKKYPKSTLLPAVWFRRAENACMNAIHYGNSRSSIRREDLDSMFKEAIRRYQRLLDKFPDFAQAHTARFGMATAQYRLGWYPDALAVLSSIPAAERMGKLAPVAYLMADCHIRMFPARTDDALSAAKLVDSATKAAKLLEGFVTSNAKSPQAPDALLKLGHCYQRIGAILDDAAKQKNSFTQARGAYERLLKQYPKDPLVPAAVFERAKCIALLGDAKTAMEELERFQRDPYAKSEVAVLAIVRLSSLMRSQKRAIDAARVLKQFTERHRARGSSMRSIRRDWLPVLQYEHGLAVMETGEFATAGKMFDDLVRRYPGGPEAANAIWRAGQCQRMEVQAALDAASKLAAKSGASREERSDASRRVGQAVQGLSNTAATFKARTDALAKSAKGSEPHLRMIYETAWCYRELGDREIDSARRRLQRDIVSRVQSRWRRARNVERAPALKAPHIPLADIPVQPSEKLAHKQYADIAATAPQAPLAARARFELAEMLAKRGQSDRAVELLETALENNPPKEFALRMRLRLAASLLDRGDPKRALAQIKLVAPKAAGSLAGRVKFLSGEVYIRQKEWAKAIEQLIPFSNTEPFRRMPGITDRALLRLGHAYAQTGNWGQSRNILDSVPSHFPRSPWIHEARYGSAHARQKVKDYQYAVQTYAAIVAQTAGRIAARAQMQIGMCYMEQGQFDKAATELLVVPYTYGYPECSVQATCQAAEAYVKLKKPDQAIKLWRSVVKQYPQSKWAKTAGQRLAVIKPTKKKP